MLQKIRLYSFRQKDHNKMQIKIFKDVDFQNITDKNGHIIKNRAKCLEEAVNTFLKSVSNATIFVTDAGNCPLTITVSYTEDVGYSRY